MWTQAKGLLAQAGGQGPSRKQFLPGQAQGQPAPSKAEDFLRQLEASGVDAAPIRKRMQAMPAGGGPAGYDADEASAQAQSQEFGIPIEYLRKPAIAAPAPPPGGIGVDPGPRGKVERDPKILASPSGFQKGPFGAPGAGLLQGKYPGLAEAGGVAPAFPATLDTPERQRDFQVNLEQNAMREDLRQMFPSASDLQGRARLDAMQAEFKGLPQEQASKMLMEGLGQADRAYQGGLETQAGLLGQQTRRDMDLARLGFDQSKLEFDQKDSDRRFELEAAKAERERFRDDPRYQTYLAELERFRQTGFLPDDQESNELLARAEKYKPGLRTPTAKIGLDPAGGGGEAPPPPEKEAGLRKTGGGEGASTVAARIHRARPKGPGMAGKNPQAEIQAVLAGFSDEELANKKTFGELNRQLIANYGDEWTKFQGQRVSSVNQWNSEAVKQLQRMDAAASKLGMARPKKHDLGSDVLTGAAAGGTAGGAMGFMGGPLAGITVPVGAAMGTVAGGIGGGLNHIRKLIWE
jgi:hypothetical protein